MLIPESAKGERELIRRIGGILSPSNPSLRVPFGDDMASVPSSELLWTVDTLMDGVDFDSRTQSWRLIGRKALAVNLSDCAAMGATPVGALCAVALANSVSMDAALELAAGMAELGSAHGCPIVGGDTNSWDAPTVISVTVAAACERPILRGGGRVGDRVFVTGPLGGSILGRHLSFEPRVALAKQLVEAGIPTSMIDISDGLSVDLGHICDASNCGAMLDASLIDAATHDDAQCLSAQTGKPPREHALHDGEDFELIVCCPPERAADCARLGLLPLGELVAGTGLTMRDADGGLCEIPRRGWEHFR
ncbi:MAG: thiamine-phosphate kinase [Phycisphaerae bacterium]